jgi:hypothetical protein
MEPRPKLPQDFVDLLTEFAAFEVRYLVIGGYAVGFHDRPRATKDLDLLVEADPQNVRQACEALAAFGAPVAIIDAFRNAASDEVAHISDLIAMKQAADRDQDRVDIKRLERRRLQAARVEREG